MVNEKKVRLMTQLALDEKRFYKDELDESDIFVPIISVPIH